MKTTNLDRILPFRHRMRVEGIFVDKSVVFRVPNAKKIFVVSIVAENDKISTSDGIVHVLGKFLTNFVCSQVALRKRKTKNNYRKVTSSKTSRLEANVGIFDCL